MAMEVIGLYESREAADRAAQALEAAGYPRSSISVESYNAAGAGVTSGAATTGQHAESGWSRMLDRLHRVAPSHDTDYYSQGMRSGQTLVTVTTTDEASDEAADILDQYGSLDIDDQASQYRAGQATATDTTVGTAGVAAQTADQAVIPIVEEELAVGKRQVRRGGVRVYQHVTERPVEEQVTLREETVTVDRHPVDRAATEADFQSRDFTVTETAEQAVVAKNARVVEEVVVGKTAQEHTETVRDTVRRTDVEVEQVDGVQTDARDITR